MSRFPVLWTSRQNVEDRDTVSYKTKVLVIVEMCHFSTSHWIQDDLLTIILEFKVGIPEKIIFT